MRISALLAVTAFLIAVAFPVFAHKDDDTAPVSGNTSARKVLLGTIQGLAKQGDETIGMVGELDKAFLAPLVCRPLYKNICVVSQEARNKRIKRLTGAIEGGEVICPEGDEDCARE